MPNQWARSQLVCFNKNQITISSNQREISISSSTDVFEVYIIITIPTLLSISHDEGIMLHITAKLKSAQLRFMYIIYPTI